VFRKRFAAADLCGLASVPDQAVGAHGSRPKPLCVCTVSPLGQDPDDECTAPVVQLPRIPPTTQGNVDSLGGTSAAEVSWSRCPLVTLGEDSPRPEELSG
jgi:hypothetical protein